VLNYFKVKEQVNCGSCNGANDITLLACDYCGSNFHTIDPSAHVLSTREKIDTHFMHGEFEAAKELVLQNRSDAAIIQFRTVIVELNDIIVSDSAIDPHRFRINLDKLWDVIAISQGYYAAYCRYIYSILPYSATTLTEEACRTILEHGLIQQYEAKGMLAEALKLQFASNTLEDEIIKEVKFYTDPGNQIDDPSFLKKKQYVLQLYQETIQNL
jgi:hypothetical protein